MTKKEFKRRERKEITHRNGKPLLTMKMIREMKKHTNPLEQLIIIINSCFPTLLDDLGNLTDVRNQSYIEYKMQEIAFIRLMALCCGIQSMQGIITRLNKEEFIKNVNNILGTNLKSFPCDDTISNVINSTDVFELARLRTKLVRKLIESKTLDKFRLSNGSFYVVIDGTGLFSTRIDLGKNCIYKVHNKGTEKEYIEYQYYVLEAKLICGDYAFSFATEFVENEYMNTETDKQDCELNAAYRLLDKIREEFPKLPITIGADALYVKKTFMDACLAHHMDFILRYKSTVMSTIMEEFNNLPKKEVAIKEVDIKNNTTIENKYEYANDVGFGTGTKKTEGKVNVIRYTISQTDDKPEKNDVDKNSESEDKPFMFVTSIYINALC